MKAFLKGFFQDPGGKSSMTRFSMWQLGTAATVVALSFAYMAIWMPDKISTSVVAGYSAVLAALITNGVVALYKRTTTPDSVPPANG